MESGRHAFSRDRKTPGSLLREGHLAKRRPAHGRQAGHVPDHFKLQVRGAKLQPNCKVRWRKDKEIGVQFFP
jgi:hypothetical protein